MSKNILVTGGAGFIGSHFVIRQIKQGHKVVVLDKLSYAANLGNLATVENHPNFTFVQGDINNAKLVSSLLTDNNVNWVAHFAAESHVDNSISGPDVFMQANIMGTFTLLQEALRYWKQQNKPADFRFLHVSTDEVYGELPLNTNEKFTESTAYAPNSPYSASKAASDHLARAWYHTYGLPVIITNCSNNYGPHQHHEKLIPHMIHCALNNKPLPVYGNGKNIRDWIYVEDHAYGVELALNKGNVGESYCFGGNNEQDNLSIVKMICSLLDEIHPREDRKSYQEQIAFVNDRLGHDLRYAIDDSKARNTLGYTSQTDFSVALEKTIRALINQKQALKSFAAQS